MLKWLWKMFLRYVIGYYVPPGMPRPAPPRPPSKWDDAEGKIVVMNLSYTEEGGSSPVTHFLEVYVHGLSEDRKMAYCVAKPNTRNFSLTTNWFPESVYNSMVQGIVGPIPEDARINMAEVLTRPTVVPAAPQTAGTKRRRPSVQPAPATPAAPTEPQEQQLREIDLPPDQPTEPTP